MKRKIKSDESPIGGEMEIKWKRRGRKRNRIHDVWLARIKEEDTQGKRENRRGGRRKEKKE